MLSERKAIAEAGSVLDAVTVYMIRGGWEWKETPDDADEVNSSFIYTNSDIQRIMKTAPLSNFIYVQRLKYISHIFRLPNTSNTMKMLMETGDGNFLKYLHASTPNSIALDPVDGDEISSIILPSESTSVFKTLDVI